jgi:aspartate/methionine/tyrosine aminotransferase
MSRSSPSPPVHPLPGRLDALRPFLAMEVMERAQEIERGGRSVIHLELGEPDFDPPAEVFAACREAMAPGRARYTDSRGLPELREAIAADYERRFDRTVSPERVMVTAGTSPAMLIAFSLLLEPGAEVIVPTPHYPCYPNFIRYCGGEPVFVRTDPADGHRIDPDAVRSAVTPRTACIVVASPANPTGAVQSAQTLRALAGIGLPLVSDEIYEGLVYGEGSPVTALQFGDDVFALDGFSKRYAMTGFRLGWVVLPEWALRPARILAQNLFISVSSFVQEAGIAALAHGGPTVEAMRSRYARRRDLLVDGLRRLGFGIPRAPEGAFYVLADASRFGDDSLELAFTLLDRAGVGTTPGIDFGEAGEGMLRFCYAVSEEKIEEGLARLAPVLAELGALRGEAETGA